MLKPIFSSKNVNILLLQRFSRGKEERYKGKGKGKCKFSFSVIRRGEEQEVREGIFEIPYKK